MLCSFRAGNAVESAQKSGKYLACFRPSRLRWWTVEDKLRRQSGRSGILFTGIDDEFSLVRNSCTGKTHPRLFVDEREP